MRARSPCLFYWATIGWYWKKVLPSRMLRQITPSDIGAGANLKWLCNDAIGLEKTEKVKAATGFEPVNGGFADLSLNHLGTPP